MKSKILTHIYGICNKILNPNVSKSFIFMFTCTILVGAQTFKTKTIKDSLAPKWQETFEVRFLLHCQCFTVLLFFIERFMFMLKASICPLTITYRPSLYYSICIIFRSCLVLEICETK